jgi:hypothetical protein
MRKPHKWSPADPSSLCYWGEYSDHVNRPPTQQKKGRVTRRRGVRNDQQIRKLLTIHKPMTRIKQEISAGRIQSPSYNAGYDTVLPPQARAELGAPPKRPRILDRTNPKEPTRLSAPRLLFGVFLALLIVSAICSALRQMVPPRTLSPKPSTSPAGAQSAHP